MKTGLVAEAAKACPALYLMLLEMGTNDTVQDHMEQIKRTSSELWEKK